MPVDPAELSPDQRLDALAAILASGILRLQSRATLSAAESGRTCLDVCPEKSVTASRG